ncbi:DNA topoisomerase 2 [Histomonas meleagridis]|uniref:DNA topoisomerase 2 n=1 Tax=Histomonas meleagridis TaxID=135588 RepID=UPI003559918A|nr:DNA topoisomerase 2 [Histomonas meleagridis]KAH0803557.1 DNA topoisomerase 2 [Histomonas meleagridis]
MSSQDSEPMSVGSKEDYEKLDLREHILKRPESYIGSKAATTQPIWVVDDGKMNYREITYVPGLYKIFDEILVNAADNCQRQPPTKTIKVEINPDEGYISVWNDGKGIPIEEKYVEKEDKKYWIPEFIFGNLLTSSNFNDEEKRVTGGRNGFGAKLTNIYSTRFIVECVSTDPSTGQFYKYTQEFTDHMENIGKPKIKKLSGNPKTSTLIKFYPDVSLFHMDRLDDDIISLLTRRVWDMAGVLKGCAVYLNNSRTPIRSWEEYCKLFLPEGATLIQCEVNPRWRIAVAASPDQSFQQISFVNAVSTIRGGTHVDLVTNQITKFFVQELSKGSNKVSIKTNMAKQFLFVFVNSLIENPSFDSQTKETLTLPVKEFGSKCDIPENFLKKLMKTEIPGYIREYAKYKENSTMQKMGGKKQAKIYGMAKLTDANEAGRAKSSECTLILTEGDSAKGMAVTGVSVVGHDYFGVFPLRGKLLNTRDISAAKLAKNAEIQNIMKIMALKPGKKYDDAESLKELRYGSIMIMADQDQDGSHIKGLIINFIHSMWPSLLKRPKFLCEFITPIVKVTKGKEKPIAFYTLPEFIAWKKEHNDGRGYAIKYYKGLATSDDDETKEYFSNMKKHRIYFKYQNQDDEECIQLAFSKKRADDRKQWLANLDPATTYLGQDTPTVTYKDFVDKELILFSNYANVRAIPSVIDGLKPGQRKVLWVSLKNKINKDLKVVQLAGKVSEQSAYHHGEDSLNQTITAMAQSFVWSNNINLFVPQGQFGTRLKGGTDAGAPRYIYTRLSPITRKIFHKDDDQLLEYLTDEGIPIEPKYYVPIIPMVLVNGSNGIGVGWSSNVPCYNPKDIVANIKRKINGEELEPMIPWYSGFTGTIEKVGQNKDEGSTYMVKGIAKEVTSEMISITELPIEVWTNKYKSFLESLITGEGIKEKKDKTKGKASQGTATSTTSRGRKKKTDEPEKPVKFEPLISDIRDNSTNNTVDFDVYVNEDQMEHIKTIGIEKFFKLSKSLKESNMTLFDPEGRIKQYHSPEEILNDFYDVRLSLYEERKTAILEDLRIAVVHISNQARFIKEFIEGVIELRNIPQKTILLNLKARKYDLYQTKGNIPKKVADDVIDTGGNNDEEEEQLDQNDTEIDTLRKGYNYLLSMKISTLTQERFHKLLKEKEQTQESMQRMMEKQPTQMWLEDLEEFEAEYEKFEREREAKRQTQIEDVLRSKRKSKSTVKITQRKRKPKVTPPTQENDSQAGANKADVDAQVDANNTNEKKAAPVKKERKPRVTKSKAEPKKKAPVKKEVKKETKKPTATTTSKRSTTKKSTAFEDSDSDIELDDSSSDFGSSSIASNYKPRAASMKQTNIAEMLKAASKDSDDDESSETTSDDESSEFEE